MQESEIQRPVLRSLINIFFLSVPNNVSNLNWIPPANSTLDVAMNKSDKADHGCSNNEADHLNCASLIYIFVVGKDRNNLPSKLSSGNIYCTTKLPSDVLMSDHLNRSNSFCLINWTHLIFYVRSTGRSNTTYLSDHLDRSNSFCPSTWTDLIVSVWSTGPVEYSLCDHLDRSNTFWPINWTDVIFSVWSTGPVEYSLPDLLDRWYNFCPIN